MQRPPLDAEQLRRSAVESPELAFFSRIDVVESTGSTNADLIARAADPDADHVVLLAETQVQGRGRHARSWVSPPRAQLAMSLLVRLPGIGPASLAWLALLTGVGRGAGRGPPAGGGGGGGAPAVVIGLGLNVSLTEAELPVPHATSLTLAGARQTDRTVLVRSLLTEFARRFTAWRDADWAIDELAAAYRERCATIGTEVRAELPGGRALTGVAADVDDYGRLLIGGEAVSAGDVTHLRAQY
ncbi:biotin--[acetyl-CoA-carboxylase] ligase [Nocardia abscessus]|uniref:biotin--[acetyl-CoA-carboxylase] ligase n=1 Tax=Nocardia abscessus TaxID=120957 RepID=UPI002457EA7A|nr:biotin--[acetyl-CoA-carboxylase] ligase [Nocardia abscessus]